MRGSRQSACHGADHFLRSYGQSIRRPTAPVRPRCQAATQANLEVRMPDLNNAQPEPPDEAKAKLEENERESRKLDSPARTNESTIDPEKPEDDIMKGYHGG
jgi:hypothetical protein